MTVTKIGDHNGSRMRAYFDREDGARHREQREAAGMSVGAIARAVGCFPQQIEDFERGHDALGRPATYP